MNDKLRRAIKTGIIDEDYKDYLAVEKIPHDFSEKYEQRIGELIKTNRKSGHRHPATACPGRPARSVP